MALLVAGNFFVRLLVSRLKCTWFRNGMATDRGGSGPFGHHIAEGFEVVGVCGVMNANLVAHQLDRICSCSVYSLFAILAEPIR